MYVADGGHRENLGLVELLRATRRGVLYSTRAATHPGRSRPSARRSSSRGVELGIDVDVSLDDLCPAAGASVPVECTVEGVVTYPADLGGGTGRLIYGRAQLSEAAMPDLHRYGAVDERFPDYSTLDQFLTEAEHLQLVALGHHVAERMVARHDGGNSIQPRV